MDIVRKIVALSHPLAPQETDVIRLKQLPCIVVGLALAVSLTSGCTSSPGDGIPASYVPMDQYTPPAEPTPSSADEPSPADDGKIILDTPTDDPFYTPKASPSPSPTPKAKPKPRYIPLTWCRIHTPAITTGPSDKRTGAYTNYIPHGGNPHSTIETFLVWDDGAKYPRMRTAEFEFSLYRDSNKDTFLQGSEYYPPGNDYFVKLQNFGKYPLKKNYTEEKWDKVVIPAYVRLQANYYLYVKVRNSHPPRCK